MHFLKSSRQSSSNCPMRWNLSASCWTCSLHVSSNTLPPCQARGECSSFNLKV